MEIFKRLVMFAIVATLVGCGSAKKLDKAEIKKLKKVAVVMYTVPETISFKSDPRDGEKGLIASVIDATTAKNGTKAATIAHANFVKSLRANKNLPFEVMSYEDMMKQKGFRELYVPPKKEKKKGLMDSALSMFGPKTNTGAAPDKLNQYGLVQWKDGSALTGADGEKDYIMKAMETLKVDGVIVINDPGFAFVCEACVGNTGAASTGSAFTATLVTRGDKVALDMQEYFMTTDAQAAMVTGTVNPLQHEALFEEHGRKMATVFSDFLNDGLKQE